MAYCIWKSYKLNLSGFAILERLRNQRNCFFLDSSLSSDSLGRYSFLGIDPFLILQTKNKEPFKQLRTILENYQINTSKYTPPFLGGAVGFFGYDLGFLLEEKLQRKNPDDLGLPDCFFGFYNTIVIIDNLKKLLYIFAVGFPEKKYLLQKALCKDNLRKIDCLLSKDTLQPDSNIASEQDIRPLQLKSNFTRQDYLLAVRKAKEYIKKGDIYQVNLSQRFQTQANLADSEIYRRLRKLSPSFFSAYFDAGEFQILSSSPERFLKLDKDYVMTRPMKGTRSRGDNPTQDASLKKELLNSSKDKAELTMIVDLERNDLGKVCKYDSIKVNKLRELEGYNTVFQTTATICGRLHKNKDRIDLLRACFPGGSITGCPKLRSMEIIEELEPNKRYIYTGSLGYLSFCGNMDLNILIRTILKKGSNIYFGVGGGIVADSVPEAEYTETLVKARAMIQAINTGTPSQLIARVSPKRDTFSFGKLGVPVSV